MYSRVITTTGWTWDYIDEYLTLPRLNALVDHWAKYPPVHVTAALFAGIKPSATKSSAQPRQIANLWQAMDVMNDAEFFARVGPGVAMKNMALPK